MIDFFKKVGICFGICKKHEETHYDIGLVNFYHSQNYGACLTAYALQEIILELGYTCAYVNEFRLKKRDVNRFGRVFVNKYLKLMPKFHSTKKAGKMADIFITGSDQVFRPSYMKRKGKRDKYLLAFAKDAKKIAFSASFGIGEEEFKSTKEKIKKDYKKLLSDFDFISCREESGVEICKKEFSLPAEWIIDPVFILGKDRFAALAGNSKKSYRNKIVSYILDKNPVYNLMHEKLSAEYGMNIENLASEENSVEDWLKAFIEAEYIVTDSFHGVCFAIIFNKPFIAVMNRKRGTARFESLQKMFGLKEQFLADIEEKNIAQLKFANYDTAEINRIIAERKEDALQTLARELGTKSKKFITNNCTGCGVCSNICPHNAIKMKENEEGFLYPSVDASACIDCGMCQKRCPVNSKIKSKNLRSPECYAVMASDEIRMSGVSSGGVSHVMLSEFLQSGGYVAGAVYDKEYRIEHIVTDKEADLAKIRGSKYFQSNTKSVYREIKNLLDTEKKVLFTGTPCQVAGLKSFIGREYDNLLTIDIVCHGVPPYKLFRMFIDSLGLEVENISGVNFRDKKDGWNPKLIFSVVSKGEKHFYDAKSTTFMSAFLYNYSLRKSCFICPFQKTPRQGDITIGDFWRIQRYKKSLDDMHGTSVLLINNSKGKAFFNRIKAQFKTVEAVPYKYAVKGNKNLKKPTKMNPDRDYFMANVNNDNFRNMIKHFLGGKFNG